MYPSFDISIKSFLDWLQVPGHSIISHNALNRHAKARKDNELLHRILNKGLEEGQSSRSGTAQMLSL